MTLKSWKELKSLRGEGQEATKFYAGSFRNPSWRRFSMEEFCMEPERRGGGRLYLGWKNSAWNRRGGEGVGFIYPSHRNRTDFLFPCWSSCHRRSLHYSYKNYLFFIWIKLTNLFFWRELVLLVLIWKN